MKHITLFLISLYQVTLSPFLRAITGGTSGCKYPVSCSQYTKEMVQKHGAIKGISMGLKRLATCQPLGSTLQ